MSTRAIRETATDAEGRHSLTNLGPGQYEVRAEHSGFKTALQRGVILAVGGSAVVELTMEVEAVSDVMVVKQEEQLIETSRAEISHVVNEQSIESLPIIGRNFVDFVKLSSFVAPGRENIGGGAFKEPDIGVGATAAILSPKSSRTPSRSRRSMTFPKEQIAVWSGRCRVRTSAIGIRSPLSVRSRRRCRC